MNQYAEVCSLYLRKIYKYHPLVSAAENVFHAAHLLWHVCLELGHKQVEY